MMYSIEIKSHLESLRSLYQKGLVSVMIGAGFSKNVCSKYPNWNELLSDLVIELYERSIITEYDMQKNSIPGFNISFDDFKDECVKEIIEQNGHTKLVSQYIRKKGYRESIEHYIEERIPYIDKTCNQLCFCGKNKGVRYSIIADDLKVHSKLLEGQNWDNIYTTNYDCLLEYTAKSAKKNFRVITEAHDLSLSKQQPSIIKLHGSLNNPNTKRKFIFDGNAHHQYIISEEDYLTYPEKHEAFTQFMRISLLQGTFCLIGFSGNDPNFLAWINWVRDLLVKKEYGDEIHKKIYLIDLDCSLPDESKYIFFDNHNIAHIPLNQEIVKSIINSNAADNKSLLCDFFSYLYDKSDNAEIRINQKSIYTQLWSKVYTEKIEGFPPKIISTNLDTEILNQLIELKSWTRVTKIFSNQENYLSRIYKKDRLSQSEAILAILALEDLGCPLSYYPELSQKLNSAELPEAQKFKLKKLQERSNTLSLTSFTKLHDITDTYENVLRALFSLDFETAECILIKWAPLGKDKLKKALLLSLFNDNLSKELTLEYIKDEPDYNERFLATRLLNLFDHTYPPKYSIDKYINANAEDYWLYMDWLYSQGGKDNAKKVSPYGKISSRNIIGGNKKNIDYEKSIRVLNYLLELPALFTYHNYIIIRNNDDWYNVSKNIYEDHPYATMFYTLHCNDKSVITRIAQDYAYNDTLSENYLPDILQRLLRAILNPKTPSFLVDSILTFAGELFISVKPSKWKEAFMNIWNIKFLPLANSIRNHNPILKFVLKAIRFIDNGKTRIQIAKDCLTHSNSENYEAIINLLYLLQIKNKDKKNITLIKANLDQFINNISNPYEITISGNIKPLLTNDHIKIIQSRLKVLMENSNTPEVVYRSAVNFVKNSKLETDFFIESLIKSKNLWDNGILSKGQTTECHPILLSDITCKLSIEDKFIHQIYIKLKNSLTQLIDNKILTKEFTIFDYSVLLLEMQYFLNKYQQQLENFPDYYFIKENLSKIYREYKGFNSIEDGLYSNDTNVYNTALEEMYINRWGYRDNELDRYAMIITNRILFVQLGDVQTSLNYLHALLKYKYIRLDNSDLLQNLTKILEKYSKELLQKYNINVFEASRYLVSIANILSKSGIESSGVEKWKHLGESKRFCGIDDI